MRLIDADELLKSVVAEENEAATGKVYKGKPDEYEIGVHNGLVMAHAMILKAPTIEVPRWIPVTERLPENIANKVLVAYDGGSFCVGYGHYEGRNGWINLENDLLFTDFGLTVTHWMPLPDAPKDGDT